VSGYVAAHTLNPPKNNSCILVNTDKTPLERAHILETTPLLADIHSATAATGQTAVPTNLDTDLHFTCFVAAPEYNARKSETPTRTMRLIELDGDRVGPVDRGECTDLLKVC
jgi:ubiquitin carboxyl-terminal hydrolase L3